MNDWKKDWKEMIKIILEVKQTNNFLDIYLNRWNFISQKWLFYYQKVSLLDSFYLPIN